MKNQCLSDVTLGCSLNDPGASEMSIVGNSDAFCLDKDKRIGLNEEILQISQRPGEISLTENRKSLKQVKDLMTIL